jgi:hypothetical protein
MNLSKRTALTASLIALALATATASASPITMIHEGSGSGTINGVAFSGAITITAFADTDNRTNLGSTAFYMNHDAVTIELEGAGTYQLITPTRTFVSNVLNLIGFSRAGRSGLDIFNGPNNDAFATWDMTTSIGPIDGTGNIFSTVGRELETDAGTLTFNSSNTASRFTAVVVPAPAGAAILALAGVTATRRRRV